MEEDDVNSGSRPIVKTGHRKRINTTEMAADPPREPKGGYEGSRFNAVRHGVLSELTVLPWEDEAEYAKLLKALVEEYRPRGPTEDHLIEEIAGVIWRKCRLRLAEAGSHWKNVDKATDFSSDIDERRAVLTLDALLTTPAGTARDIAEVQNRLTAVSRARDILQAGKRVRQISPQLAQEIGSQFSTRIEGTCIKHRFASSSIKMYDKYGCVLRIETTINDVSFFKHHRKVEHRQGPPTRVLAPVKKTIYSLIDLGEIMLGCNRRYLAHLAALDDFSAGVRALDRLTKPRTVEQKTLKGINFFDPVDNALLHALQNPRVNIAGIRRADLLPLLDQLSPDRLSRQLRRLRDLGVIKRVAGTYRYYLTRIGRAATAALCRITQTVIIPALA